MEFFDLINIAARYMEIENPTSREKLLLFGKHLRLQPGSRIEYDMQVEGTTLVVTARGYGDSLKMGASGRPWR